jgi:hypothetical protein
VGGWEGGREGGREGEGTSKYFLGKAAWAGSRPALTKQVSKETYYRGKRDLLCADFESLPASVIAQVALSP